MNPSSTGTLRDLLSIGILLSIVYLGFIGIRPLSHPDEGRYAEIPREMVAEGDYITPRLNGVPYFYKPPLFYWLQAGAIKAGGINEWGLRFFPAFSAVLTCLAIYLTGRRLWGRQAGVTAALILGSTGMFFGLSQIIILDMVLTALISGALAAYLGGIDMQPGRKRLIVFILFYACLAGAVMTKGMVGLLIPAAVIGIWTLCLGRWQDLSRVYLLPGTLLFLLLSVPWHIFAAIANPADASVSRFFTTDSQGQGFAWFYFWHEHVLRYLIEDTSQRGKPFWYFLLIVPLGLLPWALFVPCCIRDLWTKGLRHLRSEPATFYLLLWFLFPIAFFSLSSSKLIPYILPVFPPAALLLGRSISERIASRSLPRLPLLALAIIAFGTCIVFPWIVAGRRHVDPAIIYWMIPLIAVFALCGYQTLRLSLRNQLNQALIWVFVATFGFFVLFNGIAQYVQRPSAAPFAQWILENGDPDAEIFTVFDYYQDFPVYLGQIVSIAENHPNEQQFGLQREDHQQRYRSLVELKDQMKSGSPVIALVETKHLQHFHPELRTGASRILAHNEHFTLLGNSALADTKKSVLQSTN